MASATTTLKRALTKCVAPIHNLRFSCRNAWHLHRLTKLPLVRHDDISYRGYHQTDLARIAQIYSQLNEGARLPRWKSRLYAWLGSRCLLVAVHHAASGEESIVGMNLYYLNARDVRERTIHEGFIGVLPEMQGRSIATTMRKLAKAHFAESGFHGISSRVSLDNAPSLRSALKIGFTPVEQYVDETSGQQRYYMVCRL